MTMSSSASRADSTMVGTLTPSARSFRSTSKPFSRGNMISRMIKSAWRERALARPASPSSATSTA
jgi:hypothetical protein